MDILTRFVKQATHKEKYTPGVNNDYEHVRHMDGYGFAWLSANKWNVYKQPFSPSCDDSLQEILAEVAPNPLVLGHLRHRDDTGINQNRLENTHPFVHKDAVFMHNGFVVDWQDCKPRLLEKVGPAWRRFIRGDTDTEVLFYLWLTLRQEDRSMKRVVTLFFNLLRQMGVEGLFNFIYADKHYIVITRYSFCHGKKPPSLYYDDSSDGIVVSSEPVTAHFHLFPENSHLVLRR